MPGFVGDLGGVLAPEGGGFGFGLDVFGLHVHRAFGFAEVAGGDGLYDEVGDVEAVLAVVDADLSLGGLEPLEDFVCVLEQDAGFEARAVFLADPGEFEFLVF